MAIVVWPSELPQRFLVDGYSEKLRDGRILTKTSAGPGKARRRFSSAVIPVSATLHLTLTNKARFERFWTEETDDGTIPFLIDDQTRDLVPLVTSGGSILLDVYGNPVLVAAKWLAMFGQDGPTITPVGGVQYRASFTLNVMP